MISRTVSLAHGAIARVSSNPVGKRAQRQVRTELYVLSAVCGGASLSAHRDCGGVLLGFCCWPS